MVFLTKQIKFPIEKLYAPAHLDGQTPAEYISTNTRWYPHTGAGGFRHLANLMKQDRSAFQQFAENVVQDAVANYDQCRFLHKREVRIALAIGELKSDTFAGLYGLYQMLGQVARTHRSYEFNVQVVALNERVIKAFNIANLVSVVPLNTLDSFRDEMRG